MPHAIGVKILVRQNRKPVPFVERSLSMANDAACNRRKAPVFAALKHKVPYATGGKSSLRQSKDQLGMLGAHALKRDLPECDRRQVFTGSTCLLRRARGRMGHKIRSLTS